MAIWNLKPGCGPRPSREVAERLHITPFLQDILWRRNLVEEARIDAYLDAGLNRLVNPDLWPQIPEAADFLARALLDGRKLVVWGDYDVDGTTSTALVLDVLEYHGFRVGWHIPDRHQEGYGINAGYIEKLAARGVDVLLSVDSGISDVKAITRARELGMDVVISDHHLPPDPLPPATHFFNPRMSDPALVPCPHLAGVGVAFFLMAAVNARLRKVTGKSYKMDQVLDLVALGTLADVMRLEGQNRILVRAGLRHLEHPRRPGIAALKSVSQMLVNAPISASQVSFKLAPRINAAGRMRHARVALNLLRTRDYGEAMKLAEELDGYNETRRETERRILEEAREQALAHVAAGGRCGLVLYGKQWHPGIIGIVATRIIEEFHVPCIIMCDDRETLKGSGRSIPGFDLYECLSSIPEHLHAFGGHRQAAGVRLLPGNLEGFRKDFQEATRERMASLPGEETVWLDGVAGFVELTDPTHMRELTLMEPFGPGNPEPVFVSHPVEVVARSTFRTRPDSVLLTLKDIEDGGILQAKGWNKADEMGEELVGKVIRVAFTAHQESRYAVEKLEITIRDWGLADKPVNDDGVLAPDDPGEEEGSGEEEELSGRE